MIFQNNYQNQIQFVINYFILLTLLALLYFLFLVKDYLFIERLKIKDKYDYDRNTKSSENARKFLGEEGDYEEVFDPEQEKKDFELYGNYRYNRFLFSLFLFLFTLYITILFVWPK